MSNLSSMVTDRAIEIVFSGESLKESRDLVNETILKFEKCDDLNGELDTNLFNSLVTLGLLHRSDDYSTRFCESYYSYSLTAIGEAYKKELHNNMIYGDASRFSSTDTVSKKILIEELEEQTHIEMVEDVIFWALEYYAESKKGTTGVAVAYAIKERILEAEKNEKDVKRWTNK